MLISVVALDPRKPPSWSAARSCIDRIGLTEVQAFYVYGGWGDHAGDLDQIDEMIAYDGLEEVLGTVRAALTAGLEKLEHDFSGGYSRQSVTFTFEGRTFLVTGGPSAGSYPTDLYAQVGELAVTGTLEAAGLLPVDVDRGNMEPLLPTEPLDERTEHDLG